MKIRYRHGDVDLIQVSEIPKEVKKLKRVELAYGEVTGHAHRVNDLVGDLFETKNGELYLKVNKPSHVSHEEHKTKVVEVGFYRVNIKRQYNQGAWERVAD